MTLDWHANGKIRIVPFERCCKNCYINCYIKSWRWEIKVRRIFTFKALIYVYHIMRVRSILRFLLILLVSILFSVSSRFLWLQIIKVYNEEKHIEYSLGQIVLSKRDCPLVWTLVEYTFNHKACSTQRRSLQKKQTNCKCKSRSV